MNRERRRQLQKIVETLTSARDLLLDLVTDEQQALEAIPESLQGSARHEANADAFDELETIAGDLENTIDELDKFVGRGAE